MECPCQPPPAQDGNVLDSQMPSNRIAFYYNGVYDRDVSWSGMPYHDSYLVLDQNAGRLVLHHSRKTWYVWLPDW